jgi:copper chaperone
MVCIWDKDLGLDLHTVSAFKIRPSTTEKENQMQNTFQVQGMTCGHCERSVTQAVQQLDAQATVQIDRAQGKVVVESSQPADKIAAAIAAEGYQVQ